MTEVSVRAVGALLRLAAIPKHDWEASIQQILEIDSEVLGLQRVSYWSLHRELSSIRCEMGYIAHPRGFERGSVLRKSRLPAYFTEIERSTVMEVMDARNDPRTRELNGYLVVRNISSMLDVPVWAGGEVVGVLCHEHTGARRHWEASISTSRLRSRKPSRARSKAARAARPKRAFARRRFSIAPRAGCPRRSR